MREREGGELLREEAMEGGRDGDGDGEREMEIEIERGRGREIQQKQLLASEI